MEQKEKNTQWLKISEDWEQSGLRQREYCKAKAINYSEFCAWRSKFITSGLAVNQQPSRSIRPSDNKPAINEDFLPIAISKPESNLISRQTANRKSVATVELELPDGIILRIYSNATTK